MNLRRIIKEELEAESFNNLVMLMKSVNLDDVKLALDIAPSQDCEEQWQKEFGISIEEYIKFFNEVFLVIYNDVKIKKWIKPLIQKDILMENINQGVISEILQIHPEFFDLLDTNKLEGMWMYNLLLDQPQLYEKLDLNKLDDNDLNNLLVNRKELVDKVDFSKLDLGSKEMPFILETFPKLIHKINYSKLDSYGITYVIRLRPELVSYFDLTKLTSANIQEILSNQPQLKPYFDKLNKNINETFERTKINMFLINQKRNKYEFKKNNKRRVRS